MATTPAIVQYATHTFTSGAGPGTVTLGATPTPGNMLFLLWYGKNGITTSSLTPAGWTIDRNDAGFGASVLFQSWGCAHKTAGASEPTSVTVTRSATFDTTHYTFFEISGWSSWDLWYATGASTAAALVLNSFPSSPLPVLVINGLATGNSGGPQAAVWNGWTPGFVFIATSHSGENFSGSSLDGLTVPPTFTAGGSETGVTAFRFYGSVNQPNVSVSIS
jgi:hypothetical protein